MPTARDALLYSALAQFESRPWEQVRMVDVAAAAGVSRQTLYNEFGTKEGLARALVRHEADTYLAGVERVLESACRRGADPGDRLAAATAWTLRSARRSRDGRATLPRKRYLARPEPGSSSSHSPTFNFERAVIGA